MSQRSRGARAVVFLNGKYENAAYYCAKAATADLVVAADGAAAFLSAQGIRPDLVVGDLDSLATAVLADIAVSGVEIQRHPVHKDHTDGELAVAAALRRGATEVLLAGALGALDHTLGHLAILRGLATRGIDARLVAPDLTVRVLVGPSRGALDSPPPTRVSVVALGGEALVTLEDLEYPLVRETLPGDACLGLGNAVASAPSTVLVHEGTVAVLVASGEECFGRRLSRRGAA